MRCDGSEWQIKPASAENSTEQATLQQDLAGWVSPSTLHTWQQADRESYTRGTRVLYVPTFWAIGKKAA